jgi:hypothetical protein
VAAGDDLPANRVTAEKMLWIADPEAAGDLA